MEIAGRVFESKRSSGGSHAEAFKLALRSYRALEKEAERVSGVFASRAVADVVIWFARHHDVSMDFLRGPARVGSVVLLRDELVYLLREGWNTSFSAIGNAIGGRDNSTVIAAYKRFEKRLGADASLVTKIDAQIAELKQHLRSTASLDATGESSSPALDPSSSRGADPVAA